MSTIGPDQRHGRPPRGNLSRQYAFQARADRKGVVTGLGFLLAKVRKAPEPLKQRLRPVFFHTFSFVRSAPGGRHLARLLVRAAPNLHGWLRLRFEAYHVLKLVKAGPTSPVLAGERLLPPDALAPTEATVYRRMASRLAAGR